jgi:hypothetical protein
MPYLNGSSSATNRRLARLLLPRSGAYRIAHSSGGRGCEGALTRRWYPTAFAGHFPCFWLCRSALTGRILCEDERRLLRSSAGWRWPRHNGHRYAD